MNYICLDSKFFAVKIIIQSQIDIIVKSLKNGWSLIQNYKGERCQKMCNQSATKNTQICLISQNIWDMSEKSPYQASLVLVVKWFRFPLCCRPLVPQYSGLPVLIITNNISDFGEWNPWRTHMPINLGFELLHSTKLWNKCST